MDEQELNLAEYQQAVDVCKNHDSLIRTGITIYGAAQTAILAVLTSTGLRPEYELSLKVVGLVLSVPIKGQALLTIKGQALLRRF